ncbi:hypothetical protein [Nocardia neocaledoniensis]|uniref:hypothetical protein n=1 Tax=Nocardia neocaledoniensis TaxID=236511 RepID=UPI0024557A6E|nr:hypothetical protein [Nocardia neocaledoniensis]
MPQKLSTPINQTMIAWLALVITGITATGCGGTNSSDNHRPTTTTEQVAPTGLSWRTYQGIDLPIAMQGPRVIDGATATDFDRSPAGAALAAIHTTVRMSVAPDAQWAAVGHRMIAPGPARDAWATARAQVSITTPATDAVPRLLGYVITAYTDTEAQVQTFSRYPDNSTTRNSATVIWAADGWRVRLPGAVTESPVTAVESVPADMVALPRH